MKSEVDFLTELQKLFVFETDKLEREYYLISDNCDRETTRSLASNTKAQIAKLINQRINDLAVQELKLPLWNNQPEPTNTELREIISQQSYHPRIRFFSSIILSLRYRIESILSNGVIK